MLSGMEQGEHGLFHHSHARLGEMQGYQCMFGTKTSKDKICNATIGIQVGISIQKSQKKAALDKNLCKQNCK